MNEQTKTIRVSGIDVAWNAQQGNCTFEDLPVAMMWIDTTLAGLMSGVQDMVGTKRFFLALQSEGRKSVEDDWKVISNSPDFPEGFKAIANIAAVAGWGNWELTSLNIDQKECRFRIKDSWEGRYQKSLGVCWGSGMLAGKMAGYCSKLFGTNCWADQTKFIAKGDRYDAFLVKPSPRLIEKEIENLLTSDEATRADMAVAIRKLEIEFANRKRVEEALRDSEERYRNLFENANEAIFVVQDGKLVFLNAMTATMSGHSAQELMSRPFLEFIHPSDREMVLDRYTRRINGEEIPHRYSFRIIHRDGHYRWIELNTVRIRWREETATLNFMSDITERKEAEDALRESKAKFQMLVEGISDVIYEVDHQGVVIYFSPIGKDIWGYDWEDVIGKNFTDLVHPDDHGLLLQRFLELISGVEYPLTYRIKKKSGEFRWARTKTKPRIENGRFMGARGILTDITDQKLAEEALQESEKRFASIFNTQQNGIIIIDLETHAIVDANAAALRMIGATREDIIGHECHKFICPAERGMCPITDLGIDVDNSERVLIKSDQTALSILKTVSRLKLGSKDFLIESFIDITERKRAEEELREQENMLSSIFRAAPVGIGVVIDRVIREANDTFCQMTGYSREDLLGRNARMLYTSQAEYDYVGQEKYRQIGENGTGTVETRWKRKDGTIIDITLRSTPLDPDNLSKGVTFTALDISEQRAMEKKLSHAQRMESVGTLAAGVAHDFNNLLMGIQGYASLMLLDLDASHPHSERLKRIEQQIAKGADLTKQLLGFARGGRYQMKPTDMNDIIDKTSYMFGRTKKEIVIHRSLERNLWKVNVDPGQIEQVLLNLYVNAWQAMPAGGELYLETGNVMLEDNLTAPYTTKPGRYVKISVTDTGTGMDGKTRDRIFDPFFTTKAMGRGTGLGLAMVYGIIKGHEGIIDVTSEPGCGATFNIYLPASEKKAFKGQEASPTALKGKETILLVDDEQMVLEVTCEMLASLGYRVYAAGSGQAAITVFMEKRNEIDLVILDMIMPGISGTETFDRLREVDPKIRVLLSSGYSINGKAQQILDRGCNGFLQKPFQLENLSWKVREMLD